MSTAILICGYRGHGKDSFADFLYGDDKFTWQIFDKNGEICDVGKIPFEKSFVRTSFAGALRDEVFEIYGIPQLVKDKEAKIFTHPTTGEKISARDALIEHGKIRRDQNPNYWINAVINRNPQKNLLVTDLRMKNEYNVMLEKFENVYVVRVFRCGVKIPDKSIETEHDVDDLSADFLVTNNLEAAKKLFG